MTTEQPEALRLADALAVESDSAIKSVKYSTAKKAAAELLRQHARIAELEAHIAAAPQAAPADMQLLKFYGVATAAELIAAQAKHIEKLQSKLPQNPSFAPQQVREG
jgi:hypothetical protein